MKQFDLEERTAKFAEEIIKLVKKIKVSPVNIKIITQIVGSGGSIGANYCEATEAESKRDFIHKISIAKKEIKETRHWLRLLAKSNPEIINELRVLWQEAQELLLIFSKSIQTTKDREKR
ncbi:four helix bundle protein [Candidatus Parcubacteria bacterium]|nr:four helix bundle protein [Candidatus Parcubacteria bacterium]